MAPLDINAGMTDLHVRNDCTQSLSGIWLAWRYARLSAMMAGCRLDMEVSRLKLVVLVISVPGRYLANWVMAACRLITNSDIAVWWLSGSFLSDLDVAVCRLRTR